MNPEGRFVFDTNAIISAFVWAHSIPAQVFHRVGPIRLLFSTQTFDELSEVLKRPKFNRYVDLGIREAFLSLIAAQSSTVEITETIRVCRDPRDDKFLELAISGAATCIVSGDQDLLILHPFRGIPILTPGQSLAAITPDST